MSDAIEPVFDAIKTFEGIDWVNSGDPVADESDPNCMPAGWVKYGVKKSELGWRTVEFLAWICTDMMRAGERIAFFPTSPPPYLNNPGECLSFVIELYPDGDDAESRFEKVADFITDCREKYWDQCRPD